MRLYHITLRVNQRSIGEGGIDPAYARGKLIASWYVMGQKVPWAILHVAQKYKVPLTDVIILGVIVKSEWVVYRGRGTWTMSHVLSPDRITDLYDVSDFTAYGIETEPESAA